MKPRFQTLLLAWMVSTVVVGCGGTERDSLVIYCGRARTLVEPVIDRFREETGIDVKVRYGQTSQLAVTMMEEGTRSPADVFWAQEAAGLQQLAREELLDPLPAAISERTPPRFRHAAGWWVGTSARARVLAYAPARVAQDELPRSIFDLADAPWRGRVGWAPTNASFQTFVTGMRARYGDAETLAWLTAMRANQTRAYSQNSPILDAIAAGEIDLGLTNHYYLLRFQQADPGFPVAQTFFAPGDAGNLMLVSGVGTLRASSNRETALRFAEYLLSTEAAEFFTREQFEYAVIEGVPPRPELPGQEQLDALAPAVPLEALDDLDGTLRLLRETGLL